jgi:hypothetical protein
MKQLQLNLLLHPPSGETFVLDRIVEEQLIELMAEMMLAVMVRGKETGDDHPTS